MGTRYVVNGATLRCNAGTNFSTLIGVEQMCTLGSKPAADILDGKPGKNIQRFGECVILKERGMPCTCTPITSVWVPGQVTSISYELIVGETDKLRCLVGGTIYVTDPGQDETIEEVTGMEKKGSWLHGPLGFIGDWGPSVIGAGASTIDQYIYGFEGNRQKSMEKGAGGLIGLFNPFPKKISGFAAKKIVTRKASRRVVGKLRQTQQGSQWVRQQGGKHTAAKIIKNRSRKVVKKGSEYASEKIFDRGVSEVFDFTNLFGDE